MSKPSASKTKSSSVRHTRAIQRDRTKRPPAAAPDAVVAARLEDLVHPATLAQVAAFHQLGLRARTLTLPVMMAFVLAMLWRQIGSVTEAVRLFTREGLLWVPPRAVSQQALEQRFSSMPAVLFERVLHDLLPQMAQRWQTRTRPLPPALQWAHQRFVAVLGLDGSTLDALLRKTGLLRDGTGPVLAGRMAGLVNVITHLPHHLWYEPDAQAHDQRFWDRALASLVPGTLVIFDRGFLNFQRFATLTTQGVWLLTRADTRVVTRTTQVLRRTDTLHDQIVQLGSPPHPCAVPLRLVAWQHQGKWYHYLTNILDPALLPAEYVVALYWQRWRIEDSFNVIKRLLGLAYLWTGSQNGIQIQVWATWILYAVLVDLTDAVAQDLGQPFHALSIEMVYRGLYHFTVARQRGTAADPVAYLADEATGLGILKRQRNDRGGATALLYLTMHGKP